LEIGSEEVGKVRLGILTRARRRLCQCCIYQPKFHSGRQPSARDVMLPAGRLMATFHVTHTHTHTHTHSLGRPSARRRALGRLTSGFLTDAISFLSHAISHCMRYLMRYRMRYRTQKYRMRYRIAISHTISHAIYKDIA